MMDSANRGPIWTQRLDVRWPDLDANGHVNNAVFFTYFEQARIGWLQSLRAQTTVEGYGPVVKQASCTYLRAVGHPATLEVRLFLGRTGRTSFATHSEIWMTGEAPGKVAEGEAVLVWVDRRTGRPHPVPEFLQRLFPDAA
jgi:acyl-CoA thioester hydrolase